jgi:hypothetical protein
VVTHIGEDLPEGDPVAAEATLASTRKAVAKALGDDDAPESRATQLPVDFVANPPKNGAEFQALIASARKGSLEDIGGPARNLARADASLWPEVREFLLAERKRPKGDYRRLLATIGGDVPNRYGYFDLHWKKAHGHRVKLSEDWFEDLLALPLSRVSRPLREVYRDAVLQTAMLRAASRIGAESPEHTQEVVAALLDSAYVHRGTFRDEAGRAIQGIGDSAVPHLLRESIPPSTRAKDRDTVPVKRATYATYNLDRMDRLQPRRTLAAVKSQPDLCAAVVRAYGVVKPGEAAPLLIDLMDDEVPVIRDAARDSFLGYVTGPIPKSRRTTLRLIGGGTKTASAHLSHRAMASISIRKHLAETQPQLLEPECDVYREDGSVDPKCERQPERLARVYIAHLERKRAAERDQLLARALSTENSEEAADILDGLLLTGAAPGDPGVLADFFERAARDADGDERPLRAAQLMRKSAMLVATTDPERADSLRVDALVREAAMPDLDLQGREMLLGTASSLAPESATVRGALQDAHAEEAFGEDDRLADLYRGLPLMLASLGCLWFLGVRTRRRLASEST